MASKMPGATKRVLLTAAAIAFAAVAAAGCKPPVEGNEFNNSGNSAIGNPAVAPPMASNPPPSVAPSPEGRQPPPPATGVNAPAQN
jgi:hypothetical protein